MSTIELPPEPTSPGAARRFVTDCLGPLEGAPTEVAVLLVSELATNAILHARTAMVVTVTVGDGSVRVGVQDGSAALPALRDYDHTAPTGRGMQMVERLASRWGVEHDEGSKTVWFEVPLGDHSTEPGDGSAARTRTSGVAARGARPARASRRRAGRGPEASRRRVMRS